VVSQRVFVAALVVTLAWGILAFGGNYPFAYWPLIIAAALLGVCGLLGGTGSVPGRTLAALGLVIVAVVLQLLPLPAAALRELSPAAHAFLLSYDVQYAQRAIDSRHALSIDPHQTRLGLAFLISYTLLLAGTARMLQRSSTQLLAGCIVTVGVLVGFIGIVQGTPRTKLIYGFWKPSTDAAAPFGPFVNKNHFAGFMLLVLPLALGWLMSIARGRAARGSRPGLRNRVLRLGEPETNQAALIVFACVVMAMALLLTFSRSGILCIVAGCAVGAAAFGTSKARGTAVAVAWALTVPAAAAAWIGIDRIAARFAQPEVVSLAGRIGIWKDTIRIVRDFWLFGSGLNTYGTATLFYQTTMPIFHLQEAHNDYLQIAAEGGLLVGVPVAVAIVMFAWDVRCRFRDRESNYWIRAGAVTAIVAAALQATVDFSLQMPGNAALFAVLCGIAVHSDGAVTVHRHRDEPDVA
jgi:O-antigen ligase